MGREHEVGGKVRSEGRGGEVEETYVDELWLDVPAVDLIDPHWVFVDRDNHLLNTRSTDHIQASPSIVRINFDGRVWRVRGIATRKYSWWDEIKSMGIVGLSDCVHQRNASFVC